MVKISLGGYDDGEGPSNRIQKRLRMEPEDGQASRNEKEEHAGDGGEARSAEHDENPVGSVSDDKDRSISVTIIDPDVLDCCICYEPLTSPVFQCENGHIACSNCCARLGNKCPMCSMPIGYNRCRAIEKVLESIKISCLNAKYGCKHMFSFFFFLVSHGIPQPGRSRTNPSRY
ncbi:E3 ubiquitin-protein ligase SINA-like 10 isoform X1 [Arachis hypogaea]|uniref:RING-type domain-containing protein n=1 Tax=Arachis hypogaea TaxID=3818 RepID=A0A445DM95_ARAHY|nr:hypothetical protein Ahy_A03g010475 isoform B [Arachis hypogaea]